jgi:hypothetical protein
MDTVCRASGEGHHRTTAGSVSKLTLMQLLAARWCSSSWSGAQPLAD